MPKKTFTGKPPKRSRLIIEGYRCQADITEDLVKTFLLMLTEVQGMRVLAGPFIETVKPGEGAEPGVSGQLIWFESGAQIHHWENSGFIAVDMFSCKDLGYGDSEDLFRAFFFPEEVYCHVPILAHPRG